MGGEVGDGIAEAVDMEDFAGPLGLVLLGFGPGKLDGVGVFGADAAEGCSLGQVGGYGREDVAAMEGGADLGQAELAVFDAAAFEDGLSSDGEG